jgi:hypothetical protein
MPVPSDHGRRATSATGSTRTRRWRVSASLALLLLLAGGCGRPTPEPSRAILGRWTVIDSQGINVPNSFFWFMMDQLEFREDGDLWGLMLWPPDGGTELRLNAWTTYTFVDPDQIEVTGSCRHQDPCTGTYTVNLDGDSLELADAEGRMFLERAGPPSEVPPPRVPGPSPSPTPTASE